MDKLLDDFALRYFSSVLVVVVFFFFFFFVCVCVFFFFFLQLVGYVRVHIPTVT